VWFISILRRTLIRLLLVFIVVALVTYLILWQVNRRDGYLEVDCAKTGPNGEWLFPVPCE
jgi:hypothetical protein